MATASSIANAKARATVNTLRTSPLLPMNRNLRGPHGIIATHGYTSPNKPGSYDPGALRTFPSADQVLGGKYPSPFQGFNRYNTRLRSPVSFQNLGKVFSFGGGGEGGGSTNAGLYIAAAGELALLLEGIVGEFSGRPKMEDTIQAAIRLLNSNNPYVQQFGREIAYLANKGVPLSDSDPAVQKLIGREFHQAVLGLEQTLGWSQQQAFNRLDAVLSGGAAGQSIPAGEINTLRTDVPTSRPKGPNSGSSPTSPTPPSTPPIIPPGIPSPILPTTSLTQAQGIRPIPGRSPYDCPPGWQREFGICQPPRIGFQSGAIAGGAAAILAGQPEMIPAAALVGGEIGQYAEEAISKTDEFIRNFYRSGSTTPQRYVPQTGSNPSPANPYTPNQPSDTNYPVSNRLPRQPFDVPNIDMDKPCATCDGPLRGQRGGYEPTPQELRELAHQESDLRTEIATEQQQDYRQRLRDNQRQLDDFQDLEQRDPSGRDIPNELQRKQQLLQRIQQQERGQPAQPAQPAQPSFPAGTIPDIPPQQGHLALEPDQYAPEPFIQRPVNENPSPNAPGSVKFCVQCTSQDESHKFLNGEPSECGIIPYTGG